ncbi:MAG: hypothetical protein U0269_35450 [Polyangiales bacterium]
MSARERRARALFTVVLAAWFALAQCSSPRADSPEDSLASWVTAMNASRGDPSTRRRAFELLSQRARDNLSRRAAVAAQLSGREVKPWEMLAPGRFALRFAFDRQQLRARIDGDRATVTARGPRAEVAEVPMVREEGQWRVDLALPEPAGPLRLQGGSTEQRSLAR